MKINVVMLTIRIAFAVGVESSVADFIGVALGSICFFSCLVLFAGQRRACWLGFIS